MAVSALFLQALIPLGQALPVPGTSEPLIICTAFGARAALPGEVPDDNGRRTPDGSKCLVCASLDTSRHTAPAPCTADRIALVSPSAPQSAIADAPRPAATARGKWPRAPPTAA
ncbi:MAG: hypothetical protein H6907_19235 [Hyphomicrobiales bacterium]|nr:hypothetical protein [Hyphomicrobiales bacterium]